MTVSADELHKMDTQHRRLGELTRAACHTLKNEDGPTEFRETLHRLMDFTVVHFKEEENLMRRYSYYGMKSHQRTHDLLLNKFVKLENETFIFDEPSKARLLSFLGHEFRYHVIEDQHAWMAMKNLGEVAGKFYDSHPLPFHQIPFPKPDAQIVQCNSL